MSYFWLTVLTGSRMFVCIPVWLWCWRKRPRGMVLWMTLAVLWFTASDFVDGSIAREHGLTSTFGHYLDQLANLFGILAVVAVLMLGSRERGPRRRRRAGPSPAAASGSGPVPGQAPGEHREDQPRHEGG